MSDYPWSILDIAPTEDKRAVKRAYAKKLKGTKPDEDPDGFQTLNEAYHYACHLADVYAEHGLPEDSEDNWDDEGEDEQIIQAYDVVESDDGRLYVKGTKGDSGDEYCIELPESDQDQLELYDVLRGLAYGDKPEAEGENSGEATEVYPPEQKAPYSTIVDYYDHPKMKALLSRVDQLLLNNAVFQASKNWWLLFEHDEIFDQSFCKALAFYTLMKIVQHNSRYRQVRNRYMRVNTAVREMLDDHMHWRRDSEEFLEYRNVLEGRLLARQNDNEAAGQKLAALPREDQVLKVLAAMPNGEQYENFYYSCMMHDIPLAVVRSPRTAQQKEAEDEGGSTVTFWIYLIILIIYGVAKFLID